MSRDFTKALSERFIVFDGATGTMLQRLGLRPGGCPDELNLTAAKTVKEVHRAYAEAGSDVVTTNTFGANRFKLKEYGLDAKVKQINAAAVSLARQAVGDGLFVAGDIGPTGKFVEPIGDMDFDEAIDIFSEQARALAEAGADLLLIETMMDLKECKAAVIAAKETGLAVAVTMTFDASMRTILGTTPEAFAVTADSLGVDCLGANCSLGIEGIYKAVKAMGSVTGLPLIAQANAGMPVLEEGETVYPDSPEVMVPYVTKLVAAGVRVLGGCCGTAPEHIAALGSELRSMRPDVETRAPAFTAIASRTGYTLIGGARPTALIGERINPTGRKALAKEIRDHKTAAIRKEARAQAAAGANALDINVGVPGIDEPSVMKAAVFTVNENTALPVVIDSSFADAVEAGLKAACGKALVNSVSAEEKKLASILPLVKRYGAAVIGLTLDDSGIPETAGARLKVAERILKRALEAGIKREDLIIDCLAMTVSAAPGGPVETLETIRLIKEELGLATVLGVSNISFGLPSRPTVNASFLSMAMAAGLDAAIINPADVAMMDAFSAALLLTNKDPRAERYIKRFQKSTGAKGAKKKKPSSEKKAEKRDICLRLADAVVEGDEDNIRDLVEEALKQGLDPLKISSEGLIVGLDRVGEYFASNRYYLPQVILSAETMKKGFNRLKKEFKGVKRRSPGRVLMATVEGDIHDIGKNIVTMLLENHGFEVRDLGKNVSTQRIVDEAKEFGADVVGLSALMTTTVMEMEGVVKALKDAGSGIRIIVGGAVVTEEFSQKIGADEYGAEAVEAVEKIRRLAKKG